MPETCKWPRGAPQTSHKGGLEADKDWKASRLTRGLPFRCEPCFRDSLRSLGSFQVLSLAAANGATPPCKPRREYCRMWKSLRMHGPQLFSLRIRAYSYVKREAFKDLLCFRRELLCRGKSSTVVHAVNNAYQGPNLKLLTLQQFRLIPSE